MRIESVRMNWLISLLIYIGIGIISYFIIKKRYLIYQNLKTQEPKLKVIDMVFISILFVCYNMYLTNTHYSLSQDRSNYLVEFQGYRYVRSIGLQCVFDFVHLIGGDIYTVFYLTTFVCVFLTLFAYRKADFTDYRLFPLLLLSEWFFNTVTALKQCYACAFATLFFVYILKEKSIKNTLICTILAILAFLFHTSGAILFPILLVMNLKEMKDWKATCILILTFSATFVLKPILIIASNLLYGITPILSEKIYHYFVEGDPSGNVSFFTAIKWLPFYYIVFIGFVYRQKLKKEIYKYNHFLLITAVSSCLGLFSTYVYWFYRFLSLFFLPVFSYYILINSKLKRQENRILNNIVVYGVGGVVFVRWFILMYINYGGF